MDGCLTSRDRVNRFYTPTWDHLALALAGNLAPITLEELLDGSGGDP